MATKNQQVVYAMATPPHGIVQYEYYTHQMPQSASAYATSVPMQYSGSLPPPPPGATVVAAEQNGDGVGKHSTDEGTQSFFIKNTLFGNDILVIMMACCLRSHVILHNRSIQCKCIINL